MKKRKCEFKVGWLMVLALLVALTMNFPTNSVARDLEYKDGEVDILVLPSEPTQIRFPGEIVGGFKKSLSSLSLEKRDADLIVFGNEGITEQGESIIVRLKDGRSYALRIKRAANPEERDDVVRLEDNSIGLADEDEDELEPWQTKQFRKAPKSSVAGLMREMVLVTEFGKKSITGYRVSDRYQGETLLNDGTMLATVEHIFIGPRLWGYVINTENLLDQSQKINPATFRIDGTRAVSASNWELAPRPLNIEQQITRKDKTKVYVVTRPLK